VSILVGFATGWHCSISHLTRKHGGRISDREIISIRAALKLGQSQQVGLGMLNPFRFGILRVLNGRLLYAMNTANSWICSDFKNMRINLIHLDRFHSYRISFSESSSRPLHEAIMSCLDRHDVVRGNQPSTIRPGRDARQGGLTHSLTLSNPPPIRESRMELQ
jgi:hypothetical protein